MTNAPFRPFETEVDEGKALNLLEKACAGAEDGELFLERSKSEALVLDDGRVKTASFDTSQGFGMRAVLGEVAGFGEALAAARVSARAGLLPQSATTATAAAAMAATAQHRPGPRAGSGSAQDPAAPASAPKTSAHSTVAIRPTAHRTAARRPSVWSSDAAPSQTPTRAARANAFGSPVGGGWPAGSGGSAGRPLGLLLGTWAAAGRPRGRGDPPPGSPPLSAPDSALGSWGWAYTHVRDALGAMGVVHFVQFIVEVGMKYRYYFLFD